MPTYNVHIYREMKLRFDGIEASDPEQAAQIASDADSEDADSIRDCDGLNFEALVNVAGASDSKQAEIIEFEWEAFKKTEVNELRRIIPALAGALSLASAHIKAGVDDAILHEDSLDVVQVCAEALAALPEEYRK